MSENTQPLRPKGRKKKRRRKNKNKNNNNNGGIAPNPAPVVVAPARKKLHDFKVGETVDVYFPKKNPFYLGRAKVAETGRKIKGKDYDIEIIFEHNGEPKAVHGHHLKKVQNPEEYPEIFDKDKVHERPRFVNIAGESHLTDNIKDVIRDHLDSLPHPDKEEEAARPLGCIRCHNGDLYYQGGRSTWKSEEGNYFSVPQFASYVILVPARFNAGKTSFKDRQRVEFCPRCQGGRFMELSTKHDGSGATNHKALLRMGYIGIITMPKKKS